MSFNKQLYIPNKRPYITGENRPQVDCILCSVMNDDAEVTSLLIWESHLVCVCANLYPYNAGHLLIFPVRHIFQPSELTEEEVLSMHKVLCFAIEKLKELYQPKGFNLGFNVGHASGASIDHLHQHVVPRYDRELGFVDITAGAKIIIEDPHETMEKLKKVFGSFKL